MRDKAPHKTLEAKVLIDLDTQWSVVHVGLCTSCCTPRLKQECGVGSQHDTDAT